MSEFRFEAQKHIDKSAVMVNVYEDGEDNGTLIFTPEGWADFKDQVLRTKVKTEG